MENVSEMHIRGSGKIGLIKLHSGEQTQSFHFRMHKHQVEVQNGWYRTDLVFKISPRVINQYRFDNGTRKGFALHQGKTLKTGYLKVSLFRRFPRRDEMRFLYIFINELIQINLMIMYRISHAKTNANHAHIARSLNPSTKKILSKAIYLHSLKTCISNSNLELVFQGKEK